MGANEGREGGSERKDGERFFNKSRVPSFLHAPDVARTHIYACAVDRWLLVYPESGRLAKSTCTKSKAHDASLFRPFPRPLPQPPSHLPLPKCQRTFLWLSRADSSSEGSGSRRSKSRSTQHHQRCGGRSSGGRATRQCQGKGGKHIALCVVGEIEWSMSACVLSVLAWCGH